MTANSVETPRGQAREGKPYERPVGVVLGGGGTLSDFQVGALQFLLRHFKQSEIDPQIFHLLNSKGDDQSLATTFERKTQACSSKDKHAFVKWRYK